MVTYGTYRTAVMLVTAAESKHTLVEIGLTNARLLARKAQLALNAAMLTNPYVALATVVVGLTATMWAFRDSTTAAEKGTRRYNEEQEKATKLDRERKQKIDGLIQSSRDIALSDLQRGESLAVLRSEYPKIFAQYDIESIKLADILQLKQQIAKEDAKRAGEEVARSFEAANKAVSDYENALSAKQINGGKLTQQEINKLKELRSYRDQFLVDKGKGISEQFISNLKDVDISEFDRYISELEKSIKGKGKNGTVKLRLPIDIKGTLSDEAIYNVKDIKTLIDTAKSVKQTRIDSEKNKTTYKQDYEKAKKDWDDAKKKLSEIEKDKSKFTSKQYEEAKKRVETTEKAYKNLGGITGSSLTKQENQAKKEAENRLKQQEQLAEQLLSLRRKNQQDEINLRADGTEKKLAQIDLDYQKELDAIRKQEQEWSKANGGKLTKEQSVQISLSYSQAENKRDKSISDVNKEELEAMNRYLKEYGTFQQKKDAITKEYNDKMAKVTTEGDKKLLQKEMEEALSSVDMDKLKQEINWELIFGDLSKVSKKSLEQVKQQLKTFKNSDEYKNMAVDQKKVIDAALNNIQSTIIDKGGLLGDLPEQLDALRIAQDELKQAQDEYNKSLKSGTDAEKEAALKKKNKAEKNVQNAETNVTRSADKTQKSLITLTDTITQLGSLSEMSLSQIGNLAAGLVDAFSEAGSKIGGIVGAVFSLLDGIEKQGFDGFVKNVFSSVFGAGASMWNTLTFGGFNKLFGIGGNAKEVQDSINRLADRNETLQTSIESLTDEIKASKGTKSVAAYRSAYEYQKEQNSNYLNIAREQAGYHNSHKSWQYYMRWSAEDLKWIQQNINKNFTGTSSLWELTPEEMEKLRSNVDIWTKMQNAGKGGYGERVTDKLDDYIEQAGKLEELTDNLYEGLTGMSFDSMYDSFVSSLMDMEKSAEDVADDISKYFMQAMLSNAIGEQFSDKLRTWYDKFGEAMKDDGTLDNNERKELMDEYMGYVDEAMKLRDELAAATGYDKISQETTSQSASSKGFQAMSQDTGEELNGRFTALQIAGEEIKNQNIIQSQSLNLLTVKADALLSINTETRNIADDTRDLIAQSYLELVQISENTGAIVKPIIQIQKDMAEVKNNTSKL